MPVDPGLATQNISWLALIAVILVLSLATMIVGLRFYTRMVLLKQLRLDDYFVLLTLVCRRFHFKLLLSRLVTNLLIGFCPSHRRRCPFM
jgi:hypothetical protein